MLLGVGAMGYQGGLGDETAIAKETVEDIGGRFHDDACARDHVGGRMESEDEFRRVVWGRSTIASRRRQMIMRCLRSPVTSVPYVYPPELRAS